MSSFGSSGIAVALLFGTLILYPWLGWWAILTMVGVAALWGYVLSDVNQRFYPDGTRRKRRRRNRRR